MYMHVGMDGYINSNYVQKENFKVTRVAFSSSVNQLLKILDGY